MDTARTMPEWRAVADEIWAIIRENAQGLKELRENQKATDRQLEATERQLEATERQLEATGRQLGKLGNRFGEMVEYMVIPNLLAKFEELGFTFTKANRTEIKDKEHDIFTEIDALLENGEKVMAVEIKSKPDSDDIKDHLERMEKLRTYADLHNDKRVYLGAVAGVVFSDNEKTHALKKGFYVIEPSGDTFNIIEPKGACHPREW